MKHLKPFKIFEEIDTDAAANNKMRDISPKLGLTEKTPAEPLKDWVFPLKHHGLSSEEVAARCIKAAKLKGYKVNPTHIGGGLTICEYILPVALEVCLPL